MVKAGAKPQEFWTSKSATSTHPMEPSNMPLESQETVAIEESATMDVQLLDHLKLLGESAGENIGENVGKHFDILTNNGAQDTIGATKNGDVHTPIISNVTQERNEK